MRTRPSRYSIYQVGTRAVLETNLTQPRNVTGPSPAARGDFRFPARVQSCEIQDMREIGRGKTGLVYFLSGSKSREGGFVLFCFVFLGFEVVPEALSILS